MSQETNPQNRNDSLFKIAIIGMSIISGYTTAMGAIPLFGLPLSIGLAVVLSVLLVAMALRLPQAYQDGTQRALIIGYICVAVISIMFNFNFLYGKFAAEDLLYSELVQKREAITNLQIDATKAKDTELGIVELSEKILKLKEKIKYEEEHPVDGESGKGPRWTKAVNELEGIERDYNAKISTHKGYYDEIKNNTQLVLTEIENALNSEQNLENYQKAIQNAVVGYNKTAKFVATEAQNFQPNPLQIKYTHKDIGKLDHTLWTLANFYKFKGRQMASIFVALIISIMIDLVVLFVITLTTEKLTKKRRRRRQLNSGNQGNVLSNNVIDDGIFVERRK